MSGTPEKMSKLATFKPGSLDAKQHEMKRFASDFQPIEAVLAQGVQGTEDGRAKGNACGCLHACTPIRAYVCMHVPRGCAWLEGE